MRNRIFESSRFLRGLAGELLLQVALNFRTDSRKGKMLMWYKRWRVKGRKDFFVMIRNYKR